MNQFNLFLDLIHLFLTQLASESVHDGFNFTCNVYLSHNQIKPEAIVLNFYVIEGCTLYLSYI